jgi:hypothetical protein
MQADSGGVRVRKKSSCYRNFFHIREERWDSNELHNGKTLVSCSYNGGGSGSKARELLR